MCVVQHLSIGTGKVVESFVLPCIFMNCEHWRIQSASNSKLEGLTSWLCEEEGVCLPPVAGDAGHDGWSCHTDPGSFCWWVSGLWMVGRKGGEGYIMEEEEKRKLKGRREGPSTNFYYHCTRAPLSSTHVFTSALVHYCHLPILSPVHPCITISDYQGCILTHH